MNTLTHNWMRAASGSRAASLRLRAPWWRRGWFSTQRPFWPALVASLLAPLLLLAFLQVVLVGIQRAEARHRATAAHEHRLWLCNFLHGASQREDCRAQLAAKPEDKLTSSE